MSKSDEDAEKTIAQFMRLNSASDYIFERVFHQQPRKEGLKC